MQLYFNLERLLRAAHFKTVHTQVLETSIAKSRLSERKETLFSFEAMPLNFRNMGFVMFRGN